MSDFLNDDFTEELKIYFIESVKTRLHFLVANPIGKDKAGIEVFKEEFSGWVVDAETNELLFFSKWLKTLFEKESIFESEKSFSKYLLMTLDYAERLSGNIKADEAIFKELNERFSETLEEQYLVFQIHESVFALPLKVIREITSFKKYSPLMDKTDKVLGYMSFRGEALPVIDLSYAGLKDSVEDCQVGIICSVKENQFVICAKNTKELVSVSESQLRRISTFEADQASTFVSNILLYAEENALVLDVEKMVAA